MKKLLFVLLAVCLTVSVYAIDFSAQALGAINLFNGGYDSQATGNADKFYFNMGGNYNGRVRLEASAEINKIGAWFRLQAGNLVNGVFNAEGYIYYKPIDLLDFYITRNSDGHWGLSGNALWNFYGLPGDVIVIDRNSFSGNFTFTNGTNNTARFNNAFYNGFTSGAFLTFHLPVEGLDLNIGFPVFTSRELADMFKSIVLQASYKIGEIGTAGATLVGDVGNNAVFGDSAAAYLYFNLAMLENIDLDFGLGFMFAETNALPTTSINYEKRSYPLHLGVAAAFDLGNIDLKARLLFAPGGTLVRGATGATTTWKEAADLIIDVLPSMAFSENLTGYLNFGVTFQFPDSGNTLFTWNINPYVVWGDMDKAAFYAGLRLYNNANVNGTHENNLGWEIPIGISFNY